MKEASDEEVSNEDRKIKNIDNSQLDMIREEIAKQVNEAIKSIFADQREAEGLKTPLVQDNTYERTIRTPTLTEWKAPCAASSGMTLLVS